MAQTASASLVFDGHNDTILSLVKTGRSFFDRSAEGHIDLPRAREGGLGGGFFAVYIYDPVNVAKAQDGGADPEAAMKIYGDESTWPEPMPLDYAQSRALSLLGRLLRVEETSNGAVEVVRTAAELQAFLDWMLTAKTYLRPSEWREFFAEAGYTGAYSWTIIE